MRTSGIGRNSGVRYLVEEELSRYLCFVLRHDPNIIRITLDKEGWTNIRELIDHSHIYGKRKFTYADILNVFATDEKQRYQISPNGLKIRCVQGHSSVKREFEASTLPDVLFHGTSTKAIGSILEKGLLPMKRQYVQLSETEDTAIEVGKRHGIPVVIRIHTRIMVLAGLKFFLSENNVWMIDKIPIEYLHFNCTFSKGVWKTEAYRDAHNEIVGNCHGNTTRSDKISGSKIRSGTLI
jgi:putative RNA 2'-phosphotransferase